MIKTETKFTMTCDACGNTATSTTTNSKRMFIKWARNLGWEVHNDGKSFCSFHRTRKSPVTKGTPVQTELFAQGAAQQAEGVKKW